MTIATPQMLPQPLNAALPPIPAKELNQRSDYIIVGKVNRIVSREVLSRYGPELQYYETIIQHKAIVQVERLVSKKATGSPSKEKSKALRNTPIPGKTIEVHYWTVGKDKFGPPGSQGQNFLPKENMKAKFFMRKDQQGKFHLLEPNGWQRIN